MAEAIYIALNAVLLLAMVASLVMWVVMLRRRIGLSPRNLLESLVPARPRQRPFWNAADALVMFGIMFIASQVLLVWMISQGWIEMVPAVDQGAETTIADVEINGQQAGGAPGSEQRGAADEAPRSERRVHATPTSFLASVTANTVAGIIGLVVVLMWLRLFDRDARREVGLRLEWPDVWLGLKSSVMILAPVLLISATVSFFVPYEHPVLESLASLSTPAVLAATFVGTAVVTPVVEEFLLRGLVQGSLQGIADRGAPDGEFGWLPHSFWPILVSSFVFAIMHAGQGAAPIPLFFLSVGLGYLYRQTGCLTAPIVVHMVLNTLTLIAEVAKMQSDAF